MIRQARNYLLGAVSGAGLIAVALVAFVLLVSVQVFEDWPIADLVGGGDESAVSVAEPVTADAAAAAAAAASGGQAGAAGAGGDAADGGPVGGGASAPGGQAVDGTGQPDGSPGGKGGGGAGEGGSAPGQGPGGSSGGGTGSASDDGGAFPGGGGDGGGGGSTSSTSAKVTGTVNETVNQVDQTVTGGALGDTGVTQVSEEAVNGSAGPESTVGKVVDETVGTVEGILGGK